MSTVCKFCGGLLNKGKIYCSYACSNKALGKSRRTANRKTFICKNCGVEFELIASDVKRGRGKYCSKACCNEDWRKNGSPKRNRVTRVCKNCNKEFTIPPAWLKKGKHTGQFCSRVCTFKYWNKNDGPLKGKTRSGESTYIDYQGYVFQYSKVARKMVRQHRLVMEEILGRPLETFEQVHHRNGIRIDNDPANLEIWIKGHPGGQKLQDIYKKDVERLALELYNLKRKLDNLTTESRLTTFATAEGNSAKGDLT